MLKIFQLALRDQTFFYRENLKEPTNINGKKERRYPDVLWSVSSIESIINI